MRGVGPVTENRLIAAFDAGGSVLASHFCCGTKDGRNRMPTLLNLGLVAWVPGTHFKSVILTDKGRQFVSERLKASSHLPASDLL